MLALFPNTPSICPRCAFRLRLFSLQQRRLKSTRTNNDRGFIRPSRDDRDDDAFRFKKPPVNNERPLFRKHFDKHGASESDGRRLQRGGGSFSLVQIQERGFNDAVKVALQNVREEVKHAPILAQVAKDAKEMDGKREESFNKLWKSFTQKLFPAKFFSSDESHMSEAVWDDLRSAFKTRGKNGLEDRLKYRFYGHITSSRFTESDIRNQKTIADLRYPSEWYPATRSLPRTIHLHVGPTNSGKTYHALQKLEQAHSGVYAGPLRLLAHEVFSRMNAKGKSCVLVTGEERRSSEVESEQGQALIACTVEMVPVQKRLDVAVIDEIQMIGSAERGWAWTQAFLGVQAREVHLCGEERTVPLIKSLCASIGEELVIHHYKRLTPLQMASGSLNGDLSRLKKGDCVVSFSVVAIHTLRREIEKRTGRKVATVYGSLPPETRAQQARLFNDPNNDYDYLVASDAVGMGLNLAIKRVIFESSSKFDGIGRRTLSVADIKQIGGRAGRFRTAAQVNEAPVSDQDLAVAKGDAPPGSEQSDVPENVGLVTTLDRFDFPIVQAAMSAEPEPIRTAGLFPPNAIVERFSNYFPPGTPFSYIIMRLHELSQMHKRFHLCGLKDHVWVADLIESVEGLTVQDRMCFCAAPASKADVELWSQLMPAYARCVATQSGGNVLDIEELPIEILEQDTSASREYLRDLERLHKGLVTYLWLSYRFAGIFTTRALALHIKSLVEEKIEVVLSQVTLTEKERKARARARAKAAQEEMMRNLMIEQEEAQHAESEQRASNTSSEVGTPLAEPRSQDLAMAEFDPELDQAESEGENKTFELQVREPGEEPESKFEAGEPLEGDLREQTSLTGGGDHFAGDFELDLEEESEVEEQQGTSIALSEGAEVQEDLSQRIKKDVLQQQPEGALPRQTETDLSQKTRVNPSQQSQEDPSKEPQQDTLQRPEKTLPE